ncbi:MAG: Endothelin-converting enzyme 1 [Acidobacteriales bacterium]|nr:Endothelin-converting enzyme 1 [Terriglobales bacterium]
MSRVPPRFFLVVLICFAITQTNFAQTAPAKPATAKKTAVAQKSASVPKRPLKELPYTPSLDIPSMDKTQDPCVDFYAYTCGGWMKNNPIPPDQARWNVYSKMEDENQQFLWGILEEAAKPRASRTAVDQKIGDYFGACMDESAIEKAGATPLQKDLAAINALKSTSELAPLITRFHLTTYGDGMIFGFGSNQDFKDSEQVVGFADQGGLGLPDRDYYTKDDQKSKETRAKYQAHVQQMLELLGDSPDIAKKNSETVMRIETALAKASQTRVERRNPYNLDHKMKVGELAAMVPSFGWQQYFAGQGLPNLTELNVASPEFFKQLETELKREDIANWKVYLRWHLVNAEADYLSAKFVQPHFDFYRKYLRGVSEMQPRWKRCVNWVDRDLGEALGQAFVKKTFGPEVKKRTVDMTNQIEKAMESEIKELSWMSDGTKQKALEKLHAMVNKVGYPDKWRDYSSLKIAQGDFFGNVERSTMFESRRQLNKIGKPVDRGEWGMTPPTVNAYYNAQMNDINFPAGVLQPPLFDFKMDDAPNYGNTGQTIGHELTHGFDDEGRQFDAKGNLKDWWTKEDGEKFEKLASCVSDQFSQYTIVDEIKINGKLTMGEDVADLGGTRLAYIAWKNATEGKHLMPIDGFTPDQRFFIGVAQWACANQRPEDLRVGAVTNPHSPEKYRVNGLVSNFAEFQKAFSCKVGQPMVNKNMCRVW